MNQQYSLITKVVLLEFMSTDVKICCHIIHNNSILRAAWEKWHLLINHKTAILLTGNTTLFSAPSEPVLWVKYRTAHISFFLKTVLHTFRSIAKPQLGEYTSALVCLFQLWRLMGPFNTKMFSSSLFPIICHLLWVNEFSTHLIVPTSFSSSVN